MKPEQIHRPLDGSMCWQRRLWCYFFAAVCNDVSQVSCLFHTCRLYSYQSINQSIMQLVTAIMSV